MKTPRIALFALLVPLLTILSQPVLAFEETNKSYFGGVALGGYDAVSYFIESQAVKGDKAHGVEWKGAMWLFSSAANRRHFTASPESFAPQYGGYCSNQMSLGNLSDIDSNVWRIIDNKLFLFGHDAGRVRWAAETKQRIADADQHWLTFIGGA